MKQEKLEELLKSMTIKEKIYQLVMLDSSLYSENATLTGPKIKLGLSDEVIENMGSVYNVFGAEKLHNIQEQYLKKSRLKIPLLFCGDIIYGYKTILPIPLAFGCSWNPDLVQSCYDMVAKETSAAGVHAVFSPMVDLSRDPRWGRVMEATGEDPYLNSKFAIAEVKGFQGSLNHEHVAACVKHFAAYGAVEAGREYNTVDMSNDRLFQDYLPVYYAAIKAGSRMLMSSFNTINGVPVTGNKWLLRKVLREDWGFDGVVVSDYAAILELINHRVAENEDDAAKIAIESGVDIDMKTDVYAKHLLKLAEEGKIDIELINQAVLRILKLKNDLGLFEDPYRQTSVHREQTTIGNAKNRALARELAEESAVLLKNKNSILPLKQDMKIALIGSLGDSKNITGMWAISSDKKDISSLREELVNRIGDNLNYAYGFDVVDDYDFLGDMKKYVTAGMPERDFEADIKEACLVAKSSDVVLVTLGEHPLQSGEAASRSDIGFSKGQKRILKTLKMVGKPVVAVVYGGRPQLIKEIEEDVDAILLVFWPGSEGSKAIVSLLYGDTNPSGKLCMSVPESVGQIPIYYSTLSTGRPIIGSNHKGRFLSKYLDVSNKPAYEFGYGLSYTSFQYSDIILDKKTLYAGDNLTAKITVQNTGNLSGKEIVQLYLEDMVASIARPIKELKGFQKIVLKPSETKEVVFTIDEEMLKFYSSRQGWHTEPGRFRVYIGKSSEECMKEEFTYESNHGDV